MSFGIGGIQFNGFFELLVRGGPIPFVPLAFYRQGLVSVGIGRVDRKRPLGSFLGSRPCFRGTDVPILLINVVVCQAVVSQAIVWIDGDSLIEILETFGESVLGKLIRIVFAFQIKLVRLGIVG